MKKPKTAAEVSQNIDTALEGWKKLPIETAKLQSQFETAKDLSAISMCMKLGILDMYGNSTSRVEALINNFHKIKQP